MKRLPRRYREKQHVKEEIEEGLYGEDLSISRIRELVLKFFHANKDIYTNDNDAITRFKKSSEGGFQLVMTPYQSVIAHYFFYLLYKKDARGSAIDSLRGEERRMFIEEIKEQESEYAAHSRYPSWYALPLSSDYLIQLARNFIRLAKRLTEASRGLLLGTSKHGDYYGPTLWKTAKMTAPLLYSFKLAEFITDHPLTNEKLDWAFVIYEKLYRNKRTPFLEPRLLFTISLWMANYRSFRASPLWALEIWAEWLMYYTYRPGIEFRLGSRSYLAPSDFDLSFLLFKLQSLRPGNPKTIAAAARGWKYDITLPKKIAVTFDKMSDNGKFIADLAWMRVKATDPAWVWDDKVRGRFERTGSLAGASFGGKPQEWLPGMIGWPKWTGRRFRAPLPGHRDITQPTIHNYYEEFKYIKTLPRYKIVTEYMDLIWKFSGEKIMQERTAQSLYEAELVTGPHTAAAMVIPDWRQVDIMLDLEGFSHRAMRRKRGKIYRRALSFFYRGRLPEIDPGRIDPRTEKLDPSKQKKERPLRALYWVLATNPEALTQTYFPFNDIIKLHRLFIRETFVRTGPTEPIDILVAQALDRDEPPTWSTPISTKQAIELASRLYFVFKKRYPEWIRAARQKEASIEHHTTPLHNATYWLPTKAQIPEIAMHQTQVPDPSYIPSLREFLFKYKYRDNQTLSKITSRWGDLNNEERQLSIKEIIKIIADKLYSKVGSKRFAYYAKKAGVSDTNYEYLESTWLRSLDTPNPFPVGKTWTHNDLIGQFLPRSDPRGLFLGYLTDSCQYPGSQGGSSAWAGQLLPNCGFFIVHKGKEEEIIAQSWVWLARGVGPPPLFREGLCFDNIEGKSIKNRTGVLELYSKVAEDLSSQFGPITVGTGYSALDLEQLPSFSIQIPPYLEGVYTDARSQKLLAPKVMLPRRGGGPGGRVVASDILQMLGQGPQPQNIIDAWVRPVIPNEVSERRKLEMINSLAYKEEILTYVPESEIGYILENYQGEPAGFTLLDVKKKRIDDFAIVPKFRNIKAVGQIPIALQMLWSCIEKEMRLSGPGQWTAEVRKKTSYRAIKLLAKKGIIGFEEGPPEMRIIPSPHTTTDVEFIPVKIWLLD